MPRRVPVAAFAVACLLARSAAADPAPAQEPAAPTAAPAVETAPPAPAVGPAPTSDTAPVAAPPVVPSPVVVAPAPTVVPARAVDTIHDARPRAEDHRTVGFGFDLGVPDGVALALEVHPAIDWVRLGAAVTYNGAAPGARIAVTLDPVPWRIAPTLTAEGGHAWDGAIPGIQKGPTVGYDYANFHFGLEAGNRAAFRFYVRGGLSWIDAHSANLSVGSGAITAQNPAFTGWVAPTAKLGFAQFF